MRKIIFSQIIFFFITCTIGFGQDVVVHTDKPYYVTGEMIWYKIYLPTAFSEVETTFKMVVTDPSGKNINSYFHQLEGDDIIGRYAIPFGSSTGHYTWSLALLDRSSMEEKVLTSFSVPIYNDLEKVEKNGATVGPSGTNNTNQINLRFDKNEYAPGEVVRLGLTSQQNIVDYSISVVDEGLVGIEFNNLYTQTRTPQINNLASASFEKGLYIQGEAKDESGNGKRMNQLGMYDGAINQMHLARTDDNGKFTVTIPDIEGARAYQFAGYVSNEADNLDINLTSNISISNNDPVVINDQVKNYIENSITRKKIHQFYSVLEYEFEEEQIKTKKENVKPDMSYDFTEYVQFKNLGEFFNEIISAPLKFEIDGENVEASMYDSEGFKRFNQLGATSNFIFDPLFIVNGKLTKDASFVYKIPFEEIEKVDLYVQRKSLAEIVGNFRNYGIGVIHTKNPNFTVPVEDQKNIKLINGVQQQLSFDEMKSLSLDMPQLRPLVFWNPQISGGKGINSPLTFKATDDVSTFRVNVVARTDSGSVIRGTGTYNTARSVN